MPRCLLVALLCPLVYPIADLPLMPKKSVVYVCSNCSHVQPAWMGRCPECGQWNSLEAKPASAQSTAAPPTQGQKAKPLAMSQVEVSSCERLSVGDAEFDRVLGGGAVERSAVLIGGEPGIGKSTLLLQAASSLLCSGAVLYVSGEESSSQIKVRALRLSVDVDALQILCTSELEDTLDALHTLKPRVAIVDSIQTVSSRDVGLIPGTVAQLKYCADELISWAKGTGAILFMSAHVTKDGVIAGPKSLEHMVDVVLSFERTSDEVRVLRAMKNRFGSVDEIGLFSMDERGLHDVVDPSSLFLTQRQRVLPAGVVFASVFEGTRAFVVEIQALSVPAKASLSRVYSDKVDSSRVSRVAAVIEKRLDLRFSDQDIYVNVAGGMRLSESAIDAALACALYSSRTDIPLKSAAVVIGEVSLAGEIRAVTKLKQRLKAARDMGFETFVAPQSEDGVIQVTCVKDLVGALFSY